ncbi:MAG: glycosyltransferase [Patescibacteria group bacterium]
MKILSGIDIPFNPFGGSPIICDDWYSNLPKDIEVLFLTMPPTTDKWWKMPNVQFLETKKIRDPKLYPDYIKELNEEVAEIIKEFQPDVIHMQHLNFGLSRSFVDVATTIPKIGICHGTDTQVAKQFDFFRNNLVEIADKSDVLVFPAELMANDFFSVYGKEKEYEVIPHGLPTNAFSKHTVHKPGETLRFLYAGRLNHYKGADIAVEAMSCIDFPATLDVIGDEDETGYKSKLEQMIKRLKIEDKVLLQTKISREQLFNKFSHYDAILIPSRSLEAFSLTAIEAQARGLVVIYGNGGGIKNVVGDSGICIDDNTAFTLSSIIKRIQLERSVLNSYRELGYKNAQKYKLEGQILALLKLSQKVIDRNSSL